MSDRSKLPVPTNVRDWGQTTLVREFVLAPLTLIALFLAAYAPLIFGGRTLSTFQDNTFLLHPLFSHVSRTFAAAEYPYWINTIMAGLPLYNAAQFSVEYPLYFFRFGLFATP